MPRSYPRTWPPIRPVVWSGLILMFVLTMAVATVTDVCAQTAPAKKPSAAAGSGPAATPSAPTTPPAPSTTTPAAPAGTPAAPAQPPSGAAAAPPALAANDPLLPRALIRKAENLANEIRRLQTGAARIKNNDRELATQREAAERVEAQALETETALKGPLDEVLNQIKRLGEKPKSPTTSEPETIVRERERLGRIKGEIEGAIKSANLTQLRARQLVGNIQDQRLNNFARNLFERRTSPLSAALWQRIFDYGPRLRVQIETIAENWWSLARPNTGLLALVLAVALIAYFGLRFVREVVTRRVLIEPLDPPPSFFRCAGTGLWLAPLFALPGVAVISLLYAGFEVFGLMNNQVRPLMQAAWIAIAIYSGANALTRVILLPKYPTWRLVGLPDEAARRFLALVHALVAVFALDLLLDRLVRHFQFPAEVGVAETFIANVVFALLLIALTRVEMPDRPDRTSGRLIKSGLWWLRFPVLSIAAVIIAASVLGFVALGRFLAGQILLTGCGFVALLLCHLAVRALTTDPKRLAAPVKSVLGRDVAMDEDRGRQVLGLVGFVLDALLIIVAAALVLLSWGFSDAVLLGWLKSLFFGFEIGQFRISIFKILIAIGLFVLVIFVTRLVQRWISTTLLTEKRIDSGIANSIRQGIGYAGLTIAALSAVSYIGLDVTNLAIVAGALSVGIGFGLQSIVNNFVSGLILLVERPIKVGDWIVVGSNQGYVRRINVRATEVETFDRASVIVPNSELVTGTVQNWTHRNAMGRLVVNVGVSYKSNPQHVAAVLARVAAESDALLKYPEPFVIFEDFGASSLDFSLRCYISDVNKSLLTKSALRMAIFEAFEKEGIEIPFPQHDVHLRDLDVVRSALQRVSEQRAREAGSGTGGGADRERARGGRSSTVDVPASEASPPGTAGDADGNGGSSSG